MKKINKFLSVGVLSLSALSLFGLTSCHYKPSDPTKDEQTSLEEIVDEVISTFDRNNVTGDIVLPKEYKGVNISYKSSDSNIVSEVGKVNRPTSKDAEVYLVITATDGVKEYEKIILLTVKATGESPVDPIDPVDPVTPTDDKFETALEKLESYNYKVNVKVNSDYEKYDELDGLYVYNYQYDDMIESWTDDFNNTYYLESSNFELYYPTDDGYKLYDEYDSDFEEYLYDRANYQYYVFEPLVADQFEKVDNYYQVKDEELDNIGYVLVGTESTDTVKDCKFYLNSSGYVETITLSVHYEYNDGQEVIKYDSSFVFTFSDYGKVNLTLPTIDEKDRAITLKEVYSLSDNAEAISGGNITGISGDYLFINDGTDDMTLYLGKTSFDISSYKLGDYIDVVGIKKTQSGLVEISDITKLTIDTTKYNKVNNESVSTFTFIDADMGKVIDLANAKVVSPLIQRTSKSSDQVMTVSDGSNNIQIFVKGKIADMGIEKLGDLKANDIVNITSLGVVKYSSSSSTQYQLYITNDTQVQTNGLFLNTDHIRVKYGTEFVEAIKNLEVTYIKDGVKEVLTSSEYNLDSSIYHKDEAGDYTFKITYMGEETTLIITVRAEASAPAKDYNATRLEDVSKTKSLTMGFANEGDVNALVIPIQFTNKTYTGYKETLEIAFNGTSEQTGWESLKSYYNKVSFGKLNFNATILDAYQTNDRFNEQLNDYSDQDWLVEAITYYDSQIDYTKFDSNDDGYIDCVYIIYLAPYTSDPDNELWWAFTSEIGEHTSTFDGLGLDYYIFMSYEFFTDDLENDTKVNVNCETVIHESGHALGLNDYYDYDDTVGMNAGAGSGLMMDYNVGDHDPFSKAIMGWVNPYIANGDCTITLNSFENSGDCLIIPKDWNGTYFDEYYIVDFYTPTGVNEIHAGCNGLCSISGIRIFRVDATLSDSPEDIYTVTKYDNSYTDYVQLEFISATGNTIQGSALTENKDLWQANKTYNATRWHTGETCDFSITVDQIVGNTSATITVTYK